MSKKMLIDATHAEETRVVVVEGNKVEDFDFESLTKRQLAGNIYLAKVARVEPSLQAAFVDYGGNRHGFLAFSEIHPDYYQIPVEDREQLLAEEAEYAKAMQEAAERDEVSKTIAAKTEDVSITSDDVIDIEAANASPDTGLVDVPENNDEAVIEEAEAPAPSEDENLTEEPSAEASDNLAPESNEEPETVASEQTEIEDVADEPVEEVAPPRKPRPRRYKIQEVIKVRQILLVQVVKEERGNKGAALTTYLSLAGRYCVLMPNTARGGGISRKITNADDRKKIKKITSELTVPEGAGLIVRTAGAKRNKTDIKRDYEYLTRQWQLIRDTTMKSTAPAQIHAEGDLIKRSIRDLYNSKIDEVIVEGDRGFEAAQAYMTLLMPSHLKRVTKYEDRMPLFARYQVENYLDGMFNPTVQLKSGGYLVIGITEALVAIDVNSGKSTKESSIEKTALKTNLEAAEEVARQLRLRDLAGLIVIDFIDMEERRNNQAVERKMKESLKTDRARIQVGGISGFGLLEMSRQRLRPGMIEATTAPCPHCHGTGVVRSPNSLALSIIREIEEEAMRKRSREISVATPIDVMNYLLNYKREHIAQIEKQYGVSVIIEADAALLGSDYELEKHKAPTRFIPDPIEIPDVSDIEIPETEETDEASEEEEDKPKRRRRRRRGGRGRNKGANNSAESTEETAENGAAPEASEAQPAETPADSPETDTPEEAEKPKPKRTRKKKVEEPEAAPAEVKPDTPEAEEKPKPKRTRKKKVEPKAEAPEAKAAEPKAPEPAPASSDSSEGSDDDATKRRGWWSR